MKAFLSCLLLGFIMPYCSSGQALSHSLLNDSTFTKTVAKFIRYPSNARDQELVAKVYASFVISDQGKIQQIKILNFMDVDVAFKQEIINVLEELPNRENRFRGNYILPITFQLEGMSQSKKPKDEDKQLIEKLDKQILLNEVFVTAYM